MQPLTDKYTSILTVKKSIKENKTKIEANCGDMYWSRLLSNEEILKIKDHLENKWGVIYHVKELFVKTVFGEQND